MKKIIFIFAYLITSIQLVFAGNWQVKTINNQTYYSLKNNSDESFEFLCPKPNSLENSIYLKSLNTVIYSHDTLAVLSNNESFVFVPLKIKNDDEVEIRNNFKEMLKNANSLDLFIPINSGWEKIASFKTDVALNAQIVECNF